MPSCEDPEGLWESFAEYLLDAATLLQGTLGLPFMSPQNFSRDMWDALPLALMNLTKLRGQSVRQVLHKAESVTVAGYELLSQQCRSYRYAAEIVDAESTTPLLHAYWGMGLPMQHSQVAGLVVRFDNSERSRQVISRVLELADATPLFLGLSCHCIRNLTYRGLSFTKWIHSNVYHVSRTFLFIMSLRKFLAVTFLTILRIMWTSFPITLEAGWKACICLHFVQLSQASSFCRK